MTKKHGRRTEKKEAKIAVRVFCKNEKRIEALLQYLLQENILFDIVDRQALLLQDKETYQRLMNFDNNWFDIHAVKEWSEIVVAEVPKRRFGFFRGSGPDHFVPLDFPEQEPMPASLKKNS